MRIERADITGLVLAGGRGTRMGGVDKGLQLHQGLPLARQALLRLQPQVGAVMISANRNLATYREWGVPVWPDTEAGFAGPLAGLLAGMLHCQTSHLVTVPCDAPRFPHDLVQRLADGLDNARADVAIVATLEQGQPTPHPVFALVRADLHTHLAATLHSGERKVTTWMRQQRCVDVLFSDADAFANANTQQALQRLQPAAAKG